MSNKISTRDLTEGAMMVVLTAALFLASHYLPIIGTFLLLTVGVPLSILVIRRGRTTAAIASAATVLIITILFGLPLGVNFIVMFLPLALVVGWMFAHRKGAGKTIVAAIVCGSVSVALLMLLGVAVTGFSMDALQAQMNEMVEQMVTLYRDTGMLEQMAAQGFTEESLRQGAQGAMVLLPAIMVIMGGVLGIAHFLVTRLTMRKLKMKIPRMPKFNEWHLPQGSVWGLIVAWTVWLLADYLQIDWLNTFAINIMIIYAALLFCTGLSVLAYYMKFQQMSMGFKILVIFFAFFFMSGVFLLSLLAGLFDLIFDFRKLRRKKKPEDAQ